MMDEVSRHRILSEAEGYLDLITVFGDRWQLDPVPSEKETLLQIFDNVRNDWVPLADPGTTTIKFT